MPKFTREQLEELIKERGTALDLREADLEGADLSELDLTGADLRNANLDDVNLDITNLSKTKLSGTHFKDVIFDGTKLAGASLEGADFHDADLGYADFEGVSLVGANLSGASFNKGDLSNFDLRKAILREASFHEAALNAANLEGADLSEANLYDTDLSGANLSGANLTNASLMWADLSGANLSGANLSGAKLDDTTYDAETIWPEGFVPTTPAAREELSSFQEFATFSSQAENKDFDTTKGFYTFGFHSGNVSAIAFSPDNQLLATGSSDGSLILWEVATATEIRTFSGPSLSLGSLAFSPDGSLLAGGFYSGVIKVWEVTTAQEIATLNESLGDINIHSLAFHPAGKSEYLYSYSRNNGRVTGVHSIIRLWEVRTNSLLLEIDTVSSFRRSGFALNSDGTLIAAVGRATPAYDLNPLRQALNPVAPDKVTISELAQKVGPLVQSQPAETITIWGTQTGHAVKAIVTNSSDLLDLVFSPDEKNLAVGEAKAIQLWDVTTGRLVKSFESRGGLVRDILFSPTGQTLIGAYKDTNHEGCNIKVWEVSSGKLLKMYPFSAHDAPALAISSNGKFLVAGIISDILIWQIDGN